MSKLKNCGGSMLKSERSLANSIGSSKSTMRRAISSLAKSGLIVVDSTSRGTVISIA